jgi:hypothetical protein
LWNVFNRSWSSLSNVPVVFLTCSSSVLNICELLAKFKNLFSSFSL